ncbi:hypothetical protein [Nonomuraea salmonea]|uniref:hypothetical protein n=1 Tax=Nonomuraea salmonea TaxID=46181 RepID=UPI0031E8254B
MNSASSSAVMSLKCDGTPRARCTLTHSTSSAVEPHSSTDTSHPDHVGARRRPPIQPSVSVVRPNETPNVTGLRHDSEPSADPPTTAQTTPCARPVRMRAAPTTYASRWWPRASSQNVLRSDAHMAWGGGAGESWTWGDLLVTADEGRRTGVPAGSL